ncbi:MULTISPECIES: hypothetical protein [Bacteroidaceae]|uniref:hypothetical protein n=1 Tax=Bacteroidaceae TaxID=815 RepID=UPI00189B14D2|nr:MULTISPECIES: hypothetical protein [Bacteroidaceae]MDC2663188.1 hypothetical protein [Bacteroides ovatus]
MNATDFVKAIKEITPSRKDYQEKAPDLNGFIDILINSHKIEKKDVHTDIPEKDAILDLIYNYDVSSLEIQIFKFNKEDDVIENDKFIFVGWAEAFPFAISKQTGEIIEADWGTPDYIVNYLAKDQEAFLEALIELEKLDQKRLFDSITDEEENEFAKKIQSIIGGEKYQLYQ